jgi:hypothetical protein
MDATILNIPAKNTAIVDAEISLDAVPLCRTRIPTPIITAISVMYLGKLLNVA